MRNYNDQQNLVNKQVIAIVNFKPKQIGNFMSEVLVLGLPDEENQPILVSPNFKVNDGGRIY